jgi:hypothetical protein
MPTHNAVTTAASPSPASGHALRQRVSARTRSSFSAAVTVPSDLSFGEYGATDAGDVTASTTHMLEPDRKRRDDSPAIQGFELRAR